MMKLLSKPNYVFLGKLISALPLLVVVAPLHGVVYSYSLNTSGAGWLDQHSLPVIGDEACVPTSATNAMTYLQSVAPAYLGTSLTGSSYTDWTNAALTVAGPNYLNTSASDGTDLDYLPQAMDKYIRQDNGFTGVQLGGVFPSDIWVDSPFTKPSYITDGVPLATYFLEAIMNGGATMFSIEYTEAQGGGGHELFATGIDWNDANNDGIAQESESAMLHFIDPLDPAFYDGSGFPSSGPRITSGGFYYDETDEVLRFSYSQYSGGLPYDGSEYGDVIDSYIVGAFTMQVPEPSDYAIIAGALALAGAMIRRRMQA